MMITSSNYAMLWSPHQNVFSVETVGDMLKKNMAVFVDGTKGDFIVLGFADSHEKASSALSELMAIRDMRLRSNSQETTTTERCAVIDIESARTPKA